MRLHFFIREPQVREIGDLAHLFLCEVQALALLREIRYSFFSTGSWIWSDSSSGAVMGCGDVRSREAASCGGRRGIPMRNSTSWIASLPGQFMKAIDDLRAYSVKLLLPDGILDFDDKRLTD